MALKVHEVKITLFTILQFEFKSVNRNQVDYNFETTNWHN